jgi:hypothetical protein
VTGVAVTCCVGRFRCELARDCHGRAESRGRADVELFRQELTCFAIGTVCAASFPPVEKKGKSANSRAFFEIGKIGLVKVDLKLQIVELVELCPFAAIVDEDTVRFACQACKAVSCRRCHHVSKHFVAEEPVGLCLLTWWQRRHETALQAWHAKRTVSCR